MARICDVCHSMPAHPYHVAVGRDKGLGQPDAWAVSRLVDLCDRCRRNLDVGLEALTGEKRGTNAAFVLSCALFEQPGSENSLPGRDAS